MYKTFSLVTKLCTTFRVFQYSGRCPFYVNWIHNISLSIGSKMSSGMEASVESCRGEGNGKFGGGSRTVVRWWAEWQCHFEGLSEGLFKYPTLHKQHLLLAFPIIYFYYSNFMTFLHAGKHAESLHSYAENKNKKRRKYAWRIPRTLGLLCI